jgi:hypothetical protein
MQKRLIVLFAACAVLGLAAWLIFRPHGSGKVEAAPEPTAARVAVVERGSVSHVLALAGQFQPYQVIDVHPKGSGFIRSIKVDIGDRVRKGQTLAVLEVPELQAQLEGTVARVSRSKDEQTIMNQTARTVCSPFVLSGLDCVLFPPSPNSYLIWRNTRKLKHPASSTIPTTAWRVLRRGMCSAMLASPIINP